MRKYYGVKAVFFFSFVCIALFIYNPFALYFLNDDMVHLPLSSQGVMFQHHSFRPVHDLLLCVEYKWWGINALGYHLIQWGIHAACSLLIYPFAFALFSQYSNLVYKRIVLASLFSAALFSVYAFHSESVLWLLGSGASLATVFFLLSAVTYIKRREGLLYFILSLLCFQIGLFTYEAIWAAPLFVFLLSWASVNNKTTQWKKEWVYSAIYFASFFANLVLRKIILGELGGSYGDDQLFVCNIKKLTYNGLCLFTRSFVPPSISAPVFMGCLALAIIVLFVVCRKIYLLKSFDSLLGILFISFCCALLPVITLGISTHSRESERFLYLPSVFLCMLMVYSLLKMALSPLKLSVYLVGLLLYNSYFTYTNARDYGVAGSISKTFYAHFASEKGNKDTIILTNFPRQFRGLPLFRVGFKEGIAWLYQIDTSKIYIPAEQEIQAKPAYSFALAKKDFRFNVAENKLANKKELTLVFDSSYFYMVDYAK
ncbi:hypothetical protein [Parasediminibacterium sp. JCM 36343]|uniref:hypothetical protein n=1 Tax=Parasediminibacterium sp. JCM 36343 TaxID=3374279 RepID=UPI00397D7454